MIDLSECVKIDNAAYVELGPPVSQILQTYAELESVDNRSSTGRPQPLLAFEAIFSLLSKR
jgi:hypothetical protein